MLPEEVQDTREHLSSVQCSPANFQWNSEQQGVTVSTQQKVETDGGRGEKEGGVEGEEERKEKENEVTENEKERKGHTERKSVICTGRVEVTEPLQSSTVSTLKSPVEERDTSQDQRPSERHPSSRVEPEENQVYPTTSMLTLTEDGSLIGSGSPLTVAKAAAIQHLHRLVAQSALPYDEDNTSGSEGSTYMPFASASSAYVTDVQFIVLLLDRVSNMYTYECNHFCSVCAHMQGLLLYAHKLHRVISRLAHSSHWLK